MYVLAAKGQALQSFLKVNKNKLPYVATIAIGMFLPLAYMSVSLGADNVLGWFTSLILAYLLLKWITIAVNHILLSRAMRNKGILEIYYLIDSKSQVSHLSSPFFGRLFSC